MHHLRRHPNHRLFLLELCAVYLWVSSSLLTFTLSTTPLLHSLSPSLASVPPTPLFLSLFVVIMAIWELFSLSFGSPFNPIVTLALLLTHDLQTPHALIMIVAQFLGHFLGVATIRSFAGQVFPDYARGAFDPPMPHKDVSTQLAVGIEAVLTGVVCVAVIMMKHLFEERARVKRWGLVTGVIVGALAVGGEWTGSCMNPALVLALAVFEGKWDGHMVYWVGPLVGGGLAAGGYNWVMKGRGTVMGERKKTE